MQQQEQKTLDPDVRLCTRKASRVNQESEIRSEHIDGFKNTEGNWASFLQNQDFKKYPCKRGQAEPDFLTPWKLQDFKNQIPKVCHTARLVILTFPLVEHTGLLVCAESSQLITLDFFFFNFHMQKEYVC